MGVNSSKHKLAIAHGDEILVGTQPISLAEGIVSGVNLYPAGGFAFMGADGECTSMGYAECFERAQRILNGLRRRGVTPGDKLILYFRECQDFIPTLWAALLCGAIAVPFTRSERNRYHIVHTPQIFGHLRRVLNAPRVIIDGLEERQQDALGLRAEDLILLESVETETPIRDFFEGSLDEPQILILTSGTTASPNVVTLSARALIHRWWPNLPAPQHSATFFSWSPFDHVMGLGIASPNLPTKVYLPTAIFVQSPELWLTTLERFQVTHCTMTNFGMALVERAATAGLGVGKRWNLSSVRKIGVGAEPIAPHVCGRFITTLQACGLRHDAVILGYGLSECGPVVGGEHHFSPTDKIHDCCVVLDRPTRGHSVRIVGVDGKLVSEREIGQVQVKGPTMTLGYYGDDAATHALFTDDGWLRTGDLGVLRDGRLTITGREKETIVINAKKFACMEIETIAQTVTGVDAAFAVACNTRNDGFGSRAHFALFFVARLVTPSDMDALLRRLRTKIATRFGLAPDYLIPIAEEEIPFTPTGKVQRLQLAARLEAGVFDDALASLKSLTRAPRANARSETERLIASIWSEILSIEDCDLNDDFFDLGGDSLAAIRLVFELEKKFRRDVPSNLLYEPTTIARLAAFFDHDPPKPESARRESALAERTRELARRFGLTVAEKQDSQDICFVQSGRYADVIERLRPGVAGPAAELLASGTGLPLFLVGPFFALGAHYRHLVSDLKGERPIFGLQPPPLDGKHRIPRTVKSMAANYVTEIRRVQPHGPYFLTGHSFGGQVCFEIAQQLVREGERVSFLGLIDTVSHDMPGWLSKTARLRRALNLIGTRALDLWLRTGHSIPYEYRRSYYIWLRRRASLTHVAKPYSGHITMFSSAGNSERQKARWAPLARGGLTVLEIPAEHDHMVNPPHSKFLAEHLDACLDATKREQDSDGMMLGGDSNRAAVPEGAAPE
jgi:acyl-CoA synthetase (AMP-forming)/AMP-acid ligase II/thioesterase domain-containing protein/acyl carrier protein